MLQPLPKLAALNSRLSRRRIMNNNIRNAIKGLGKFVAVSLRPENWGINYNCLSTTTFYN